MKQEMEEIIIELSMLRDDIYDTQKLINEKEERLREICPHNELECCVSMAPYPVSEQYRKGIWVYTCLLCGYSETSNGPNPEFDEKVVNE